MREAKQITEAVNYLIGATNYTRLVNELTSMIERWHTHPTAYGGHLSFLNVLIDVGVDNREAFEQLLRLVERKRRQVPITRRQDYQRELMRERRARIATAVEIHERRNGHMPARRRKLFERETHERWMAECAAKLEEAGDLRWKERNELRRKFWAELDAQMEDELYALRTRRRDAVTELAQ